MKLGRSRGEKVRRKVVSPLRCFTDNDMLVATSELKFHGFRSPSQADEELKRVVMVAIRPATSRTKCIQAERSLMKGL